MSDVGEKNCVGCNTSAGGADSKSSRPDVIDRARLALAQHGQFRGSPEGLTLILQGEVLVVQGRVPSYYLKQLLQTVLKDLAGVRQIDNQVTVVVANGFNSARGQSY